MTETSDEALMRAADMLRGMQRSYEVEVTVASFLQKVSDAAEATVPLLEMWIGNHDRVGKEAADVLRPFILPKPVDPLIDAIVGVWGTAYSGTTHAEMLREALAKRGLKIVKDET